MNHDSNEAKSADMLRTTTSLENLIQTAVQATPDSSSYTLKAFLSSFSFDFTVYQNDCPQEAALRNTLIKDGKLDVCAVDKPLVGLIDLQGANWGEIENERFVIERDLVSSIQDRMSIYLDDGVISEFEDALEAHGYSAENRSLEEMYTICKELGITEVSYTLAECIMHPEKIRVPELDLEHGTIYEGAPVRHAEWER